MESVLLVSLRVKYKTKPAPYGGICFIASRFGAKRRNEKVPEEKPAPYGGICFIASRFGAKRRNEKVPEEKPAPYGGICFIAVCFTGKTLTANVSRARMVLVK